MSVATSEAEKKRLKVLWQYEVLDTVPEALFDDLTELAACICEAPIALISLVDEKRQWFKSKVGTNINETSRDISFCSHAIQQSHLFIISDAAQDERFAQNPLVTSDPKIRFYAGAPLITPDGYAIGTLCVIDKVPRELRQDQKQALRILARHIVSQLELRRRSKEVRAEHHTSAAEESSELARLKTELAEAHRKLARQSSTKVKPKKKRRQNTRALSVRRRR
jgi:GAF domain-containing protein